MFTEQAQSGGEESDSHTGGLVYGETQVISAFTVAILQRYVHSKGAWRRQEIYTESSGPKEGCADPAQTPPGAVR